MELNKITQAILADYHLGRTIDTTISAGRPTMAASEELMEKLRILLFPGFYRGNDYGSLETYVSLLVAEIHFRLEAILLPLLPGQREKCREICMGLLQDIPRIRALLQQDLQAFLTGDPADKHTHVENPWYSDGRKDGDKEPGPYWLQKL
jgi:serine O-acetyltransferase